MSAASPARLAADAGQGMAHGVRVGRDGSNGNGREHKRLTWQGFSTSRG
jgi:hypothetical protein